MNQRRPIQILILALIGTMAGIAGADVVERQIDDQGQSMRFDDEQLLGGALDARGDVVIMRLPPQRALLIRPRVSFIPELTKSAEGY